MFLAGLNIDSINALLDRFIQRFVAGKIIKHFFV